MKQPIHRFKAEFFKTLGHPARLAILDHLREGERSVNELQALLGADQSTVSQQLAKLRNAHIVEPRKKGTTVFYSVRDFELGDDNLSLDSNFPFWEDPSLWVSLELVR